MTDGAPTLTAAQVRRDAVARLGEIAGYDERLDVDLTLARPDALQMLVRQALRAAIGNDELLDEIRTLHPIGRDRASAVIDAQHAGGIGALLGDDTPPAPTQDEFETAVAALLGGSA